MSDNARQDGWYWTKWGPGEPWRIAWWTLRTREWSNIAFAYYSSQLASEVGPRIPMPDERPADPAPTRNSEVLEDFRRFCEANPSLRFWQALKAWCGSGVYLSNTVLPIDLPSGFIDPFYREGKMKANRPDPTPAPAPECPVTPEELRLAADYCNRMNPGLAHKLRTYANDLEARR